MTTTIMSEFTDKNSQEQYFITVTCPELQYVKKGEIQMFHWNLSKVFGHSQQQDSLHREVGSYGILPQLTMLCSIALFSLGTTLNCNLVVFSTIE